MRGVGGPLLCIGDLLSDVGDDEDAVGGDDGLSIVEEIRQSSATPGDRLLPSDLDELFEEKYNRLIESMAGTDHSWTALTLELCAALKKAEKLVNIADINIELLLKRLEELQSLMRRGDAAVSSVKALQINQISKEDPAR